MIMDTTEDNSQRIMDELVENGTLTREEAESFLIELRRMVSNIFQK
jgi:polyhydroxyalkanoate synthesis regulator phasin